MVWRVCAVGWEEVERAFRICQFRRDWFLNQQLRVSWIAAFFHGSQYGLILFWFQVRVLHVVSVVVCSLVEWLLLFLPFWLHLLEVNWMMLLYSHRHIKVSSAKQIQVYLCFPTGCQMEDLSWSTWIWWLAMILANKLNWDVLRGISYAYESLDHQKKACLLPQIARESIERSSYLCHSVKSVP